MPAPRTGPLLVLPGHGDSGPEHWQSRREAADPLFHRVRQRDWERPQRSEWVETLERAVASAGPGVVLIAHSLGCLLVAHWAPRAARRVRGALLVAVPDPDEPAFPPAASEFRPVPGARLPFPSIAVASTDDPYADVRFSRGCAAAWGSRLVEIGRCGHINGESRLGDWPYGLALVRELTGSPAPAAGPSG